MQAITKKVIYFSVMAATADLVEFMKSLTAKPMQVALPQLPQ